MRSITFISVALAAGMAMAQDGPTPGCYTREYTQAHLEAYPDQVARSLTMMIHDQQFGETMTRLAYLVVDFANQGHAKRDGHGGQSLDQQMVCFTLGDGRLGCGVECDGGSFLVTNETDTTLTIATEYLMVGDTEGCGGAIDLAEVPGQEVKYRLNRVAMDACLAKVEN